MKEQTKTQKNRTKRWRDSLSDIKFETLVIRILTEIVKYGCKMEEKVKALQSEIKKNIPGTNSEGKETRTQINDL